MAVLLRLNIELAIFFIEYWITQEPNKILYNVFHTDRVYLQEGVAVCEFNTSGVVCTWEENPEYILIL